MCVATPCCLDSHYEFAFFVFCGSEWLHTWSNCNSDSDSNSDGECDFCSCPDWLWYIHRIVYLVSFPCVEVVLHVFSSSLSNCVVRSWNLVCISCPHLIYKYFRRTTKIVQIRIHGNASTTSMLTVPTMPRSQNGGGSWAVDFIWC